MNANEQLEYCSQSWRIGRLLIITMLLLVSATTQADPANRTANPPLLIPETVLVGAPIAARTNPWSALPNNPALTGYLFWLSPTAVTARGTYIYVVDSGRRQIFLYDLAQQTMAPFAEVAASAGSGIAVAPDLSLYVADPNARQVLHFSVDGQLLQTFSNDADMGRPVAVLLDDASGNVLVADSLYNHVVVFNSLGRVLAVLRSNVGRSIEAMARGPDGLYLVDRLSKQIVVIGKNGGDRYTFGKDTLNNPNAIAVDRYNRVFVSDSFDNTIKIYEQQQWVASVGGSGATPAAFNMVTGLWLEQDVLYVADSLNARIQTFRVAAPIKEKRAHE